MRWHTQTFNATWSYTPVYDETLASDRRPTRFYFWIWKKGNSHLRDFWNSQNEVTLRCETTSTLFACKWRSHIEFLRIPPTLVPTCFLYAFAVPLDKEFKTPLVYSLILWKRNVIWQQYWVHYESVQRYRNKYLKLGSFGWLNHIFVET